MNKKAWIGIAIFVVLIIVIILIKVFTNSDDGKIFKNLEDVYVATGGGKEDFLQDKEVIKILEDKYGLNVTFDTWSNGRTIKDPLIRETIGLGDSYIAGRINEGEEYTINSTGVS